MASTAARASARRTDKAGTLLIMCYFICVSGETVDAPGQDPGYLGSNPSISLATESMVLL